MSVTADVQRHERNPDGFTEYFIVIFYKGVEWAVRKRYSAFVKFDEYLRSQGYKLSYKLPGKNFWSRFDPTLISRRVGELQNYLNHLLSSTMNDNNLIREFLEVDENMLKQAKLMSLIEPAKETGYADRLDIIVRDARKAVLPLTMRLHYTNLHSVSNRTTPRQASSTMSRDGRGVSSPGIERSASFTGRETSVDTQKSSTGGDTTQYILKEKINYAGGTGSMIQTHMGESKSASRESKSASRESPSGSFSEYLIATSNGIVTKKEYLGQKERKDGGSIGSPPPPAGPRHLSRSNSIGGGRLSFYGSSSNSSALYVALAIEDAKRKEKFAEHVQNLWSQHVSPMGKTLRIRKSKKRLPMPLTQEREGSNGVARLSQLWEAGGRQNQPGTADDASGRKEDNRASPTNASAVYTADATPLAESSDTNDDIAVADLQEDIIFRDDSNSWILDILSSPLRVDPGSLSLMDEYAVNAVKKNNCLEGVDLKGCVVFPSVIWESMQDLQQKKGPPEGPSDEGKSAATFKEGGASAPQTPRTPSHGLRRLRGDQMKPLIRANSLK